VHLDGFIHIPVLIVGAKAAVRGFLPEIYTELLNPSTDQHQDAKG
jgi:hypothetical protein